MYTMTQLLSELADFRHYPPERNSRDGKCIACDKPVQAGAGLVVLGAGHGVEDAEVAFGPGLPGR